MWSHVLNRCLTDAEMYFLVSGTESWWQVRCMCEHIIFCSRCRKAELRLRALLKEEKKPG